MSGEDLGTQASSLLYQFAKYIYDHPEVIAGIAAGIGLYFTARTFRHQQQQAQVRMIENVFNDIRDMEKELSNIPESTMPDKAHRDWDSRFFNTLEWLSFLINERQVRHSKLIGFFKESIIAWYENVFLLNALEDEKTDEKQYPELKKLYRKLKEQSLSVTTQTQGEVVEIDTISRKDLFQFNAVVIAGALILLTITSSGFAFADKTFKIFAAFSLIPFLVSCIILLFSSSSRLLYSAKIITAIGFLYLGLALGLLVAFA
jgi:hypothetical protein